MESDKTKLSSRVIETRNIDWRTLQFIQQDDLKDLEADEKIKLKASILGNNFTQPFYVWQDDTGVMWCLDGRHRCLVLSELESEGLVIPYLLPATFIECANKMEAAQLVLIYSSLYAKVSQKGLFNFIEQYDLNFSDLKSIVSIPDFSMPRFEQKFDSFQIGNQVIEEEALIPDSTPIKDGDLFDINGHRVACGSFLNPDLLFALLGEGKARIVITDPPYNLPTNFFSNQKNLKDFATGHGEMSDNEFVNYIEKIMRASVLFTVPGAIHYIFMDWRHMWHMTEAGRRVYGSPEPKQLCVWKKDIMANGSFYRSQQELCFVFTDKKAKALWNKDMIDGGGFYKEDEELVYVFKNGDAKHLSHLDLKDRIRTNVWCYPSAVSTANPDRLEIKNHPTPKPVAMIADAILDTTNEGEGVIDFFLGSGTTLIACEKTRRICFATEIEPRYVHQDIVRYYNYCKKNRLQFDFKHINGTLTIQELIDEG